MASHSVRASAREKTANKEVKDKLFSAALCLCLSFLCGVYSRYLKKQKRAIQKDVKCSQILTSPVANMLSSSILANVQQQQQQCGGQHVAGFLDFVFVWRFEGSRQLRCPTRLPQRKGKKAQLTTARPFTRGAFISR